jgi:hypothetical protein
MALYTPPTLSGYNSSPPPDDGTTVTANQVTWSKHKDKLGDPLKTFTESMNTNLTSTFNGLETKVVDGTRFPAFAAHNGGKTVASGAWVAMTPNVENFDTNSNYNTTTYIFTPTKVGYYWLYARTTFTTAGDDTGAKVAIFKNGAIYSGTNSYTGIKGPGSSTLAIACGTIAYANGTTDYFQGYLNAIDASIDFGAYEFMGCRVV